VGLAGASTDELNVMEPNGLPISRIFRGPVAESNGLVCKDRRSRGDERFRGQPSELQLLLCRVAFVT
jgi:hypothetical protein